jgi:hypothetical protein
MTKRPAIKTSHEEIILYWSSRNDQDELAINFSDASERCWRCGYISKLEKCHIVPHSLGGPDLPSNYVLLCHMCHLEGPNVSDPEFFWDWLKAHRAIFNDTYWTTRGIKEYEFIYKRTLHSELEELGIPEDRIPELMLLESEKVTWHFGQSRWNPATLAGLFRQIIKRLQSEKKPKI